MAASDSAVKTARDLLESLGIVSDATIAGQIDALRLASSKLSESVRRLTESNSELQKWLDADPGDEDLITALRENKDILNRKQTADATIAELIGRLQSSTIEAADRAAATVLERADHTDAGPDDTEGEAGTWPKLPASFDREPPAVSPFERHVARANHSPAIAQSSHPAEPGPATDTGPGKEAGDAGAAESDAPAAAAATTTEVFL
jgi:hypothetical protein